MGEEELRGVFPKECGDLFRAGKTQPRRARAVHTNDGRSKNSVLVSKVSLMQYKNYYWKSM